MSRLNYLLLIKYFTRIIVTKNNTFIDRGKEGMGTHKEKKRERERGGRDVKKEKKTGVGGHLLYVY